MYFMLLQHKLSFVCRWSGICEEEEGKGWRESDGDGRERGGSKRRTAGPRLPGGRRGRRMMKTTRRRTMGRRRWRLEKRWLWYKSVKGGKCLGMERGEERKRGDHAPGRVRRKW